MIYLSLGLTYKKTPIEIRDRLAIPDEDLAGLNRALGQEKSILENIILSTCNRTQVFAVVDQAHTGRYYIKRFLAGYFSMTMEEIEDYLEVHIGDEALAHTLRLATGMESQAQGETEIFGQMKRAYDQALEAGSTGLILNHIFQQTFSFAKKVHNTFSLNDKPRSTCYEVFSQLKREDLDGLSLLLVGLGDMGRLMLNYLRDLGLKTIYISDTDHQKAIKYLAKDPRIRHVHPDNLDETLAEVDYIITAADALDPILTDEDFIKAQARPKRIYDLGLPRNVDLKDLEIDLVNIDDIHESIRANRAIPQDVLEEIEGLIDIEIDDFYKWLQAQNIVPIIEALRKKNLDHLDQVQESLYQKLPNLSDREKKVINKHMKSLVNYMIKDPIKGIKEIPGCFNSREKFDFTKDLFALDVKEARISRHKSLKLRVGTRGSKLAMRQTELVISQLRETYPSISFEIVVISTQGDRDKKSTIKEIGGKGVFVKEIEKALITGHIDLAVHSLKDVQTRIADETTIAAIPKREVANDVIIFNQVQSMDQLPQGALIGTGSMRRRIQLQEMDPSLRFVELRGNIDTRIRKMFDEGLDAIVLAQAGLARMGYLDDPSFPPYQVLTTDQMIPAVGQGALAVQCRRKDFEVLNLLQAIDSERTRVCVEAERQYLRRFGVDCRYPIGAYTEFLIDGRLKITGMVGSQDLTRLARGSVVQDSLDGVSLGNALYNQISESGILGPGGPDE